MANESARRDTILVVDDTPETLGLLTDTLDHAGFTVLIAMDGHSALELLDQITPDLVLMDAVMPGISGFESCRRIKQEKMLANLPVIFLTGLSESAHVVEGLAAGGVDYVTKPIVIDELLARIRVHLANARAAQGAGAALDASGRFLFATDRNGKLLWCTPKAKEILADTGLQGALMEHVTRLRQQNATSPNAKVALEVGSRRLEISAVSSLGPNEWLFRLTERAGVVEEEVLQRALAISSRESEVLLWVSRGKSNREIGEILTISPRTVDKHIAQIFTKLGVANRASAAARAVKALTG
ncbi:MAG TPA: DNA-binding response regulator [Steroidobacteraceae bacterium]|nr:DNA-binding response regulator [Steroidobacteraceae bacterium]